MKKITVGRDSGCNVVVPDPDHVISRLHAEITLSGATYFYRDMSMNGTVINGRNVHNEEISIEHGTPVILAGKIPLVWERVDALLPSPAVKTIVSSFSSVKVVSHSSVQSADVKDILFSFNGRINRSTYWTYSLFIGVVQFVLYGLYLMIMKVAATNLLSLSGGTSFLGITSLLFMWPWLALSIKRCHDRNKSGWFHLVSLVPFLGIWYIVEILFLKGSDGSNQYGEEPEYNPGIKQYTIIAAVLYFIAYLYFMWQYFEYMQNIVPAFSL